MLRVPPFRFTRINKKSMENFTLQGEDRNKQIGLITSLVIHVFFILIFFLQLFTHEVPLPGQKGILINFGQADVGSDDLYEESWMGDDFETIEDEASQPQEESSAAAAPEKADIDETEIRQVTDKISPVPVEDKKQTTTQPSEKELQEERERLQREEEARKRAAEEKKKQELEEQKRKYGQILSGGERAGTEPGDRGDPSGEPDKSILDNLTKGAGNIGGGLTDRRVLFEPEVVDRSQKTGTVVVSICVNSRGDVVSQRFTQRGSTTTDKQLVDIAIDAASKYRFERGALDEQCGTVTFIFRVQ